MGLAERSPQYGPGGKECHVAYTARIAECEADIFLGWINNQTIRPDWIAAQIEDEYGFPLAEQSIRRHRLGKCRCAR